MQGFDCSGFIIELLKSVGILPPKGDWTANDLADKWPESAEVKPGCLVFWDWNKDGIVDHVEIVIEVDPGGLVFTIGASGGGAATLSVGDAILQDAYIKMRPMRSDHYSIVDPFAGSFA